eukprot:2741526-Rhodomonas_salina.3
MPSLSTWSGLGRRKACGFHLHGPRKAFGVLVQLRSHATGSKPLRAASIPSMCAIPTTAL